MTPGQRLFQRLLLMTFAVAAVWTSASVPISFGFPALLVGASVVVHLVMRHWKHRPDGPVQMWPAFFLMLISRHFFYGDAGETVAGVIHSMTTGGLSIAAGEWLAERLRPTEPRESART